MCAIEQTGARPGIRLDPVTSDPWTARLSQAITPEDVLVVVRAYLDALPAGFMDALPYGCEPPPMESAQEVSSYAFILMNRCIAKKDGAALLGMSRFFANASHRLASILTPGGFTRRPQLSS
jgi:hypothetical protein